MKEVARLRRKWKLLIFAVILLASVSTAARPLTRRYQKFLWKARVLTWKISGSIPYVAWPELFEHLYPRTLHSGIRRLPPPFVSVKERREGACPVLWETPVGAFWGRGDDGVLIWSLIAEQELHRVYEAGPVVVKKGDVVLDAGGHLGTFTRIALRRGARLVVAFEPEPTNITCFKRTFRTEIQERRVILVEAALWETSGTLRLSAPISQNSGTASVVLDSNASTVEVAATTMDDAVQRAGLDQVDFIKMDIEGAERHALRGARRTLARFGPRLAVCTYHRPGDREVVPQVILEARPGYRVLAKSTQAFFY